MTDEDDREERDVSAQPTGAQTPPRLPRAHGDRGRPKGSGASPGQGPQEAVGLDTPVQRLRKRAEFVYVQKGERRSRPTLNSQARRRAPDGEARVGFTATKKIGNAVVRNRAKRRLREAARQLLPLFGLPGVDYVFLAREETAVAPWPVLLDDMKDTLLRLAALLRP
jgi:ribonuclease P protein component